MKKSIILLASILLFCSCVSMVKVRKPLGDRATLKLRNLEKHKVELLAISDSLLYVTDDKEISIAHFSDIRNVYIHGYRVHPGLKVLTAIPALLLEATVMIVALDVGQNGWGLVSVIAMAGTIDGFATGDPKVYFSFPAKNEEIEKLKLYCRYPQGLTDEQWERMLQHFKQKEFVLLSRK